MLTPKMNYGILRICAQESRRRQERYKRSCPSRMRSLPRALALRSRRPVNRQTAPAPSENRQNGGRTLIPRQEPRDEWRDELRRFLEQLCVTGGYCSLGKREEDVLSCERYTAKEFALAVLKAEGFEHPEYEIR